MAAADAMGGLHVAVTTAGGGSPSAPSPRAAPMSSKLP